jgi:hypothetical protein
MEEVDSIIILSLRQNACLSNEGLSSLDAISSPELVFATSHALSLIDPKLGALPDALPAEMSGRFRVGQKLAQTLQSKGYREEVGYHQFLYPSIHDTRRILRFLVDLLPKESTTSSSVAKESSAVAGAIKHAMKRFVTRTWVVTDCVDNSIPYRSVRGEREFRDAQRVLNGKLVSGKPSAKIPTLEELLASVKSRNAVSTVLAVTGSVAGSQGSAAGAAASSGVSAESAKDTEQKAAETLEEKRNRELQELGVAIDAAAEAYAAREREIANMMAQIDASKEEAEAEAKRLDALKDVYKQHKKLCKLLEDKEGNSQILRSETKDTAKEIMSVAEEWEARRSRLIAQYEQLAAQLVYKSSSVTTLQQETLQLRASAKSLASEMKEKEDRITQLQNEWDSMPKDVDRASYVRKIMDIVRNVKKQQKEVDKILADITTLQKDINTVSEALSRSFVVTEELIFREAQKEDTARDKDKEKMAAKESYKLLIKLKESFESLISAIETTGSLRNQNRTIEARITFLTSRNDALNAERIMQDLGQIRKENEALQQQL